MEHLTITRAVSTTTFRNNMKKELDQVVDEKSALIVTRSKDKNVVVISEEEYTNLLTNLNDLKYHLKLLKSAAEADEGKTITLLSEDLAEYE